MPFVDPNTLANGATMSWSTVEAKLAAARAYVNAIPVADLATAAIEREHIVAPEVRGFPAQRMYGPVQLAGWHDHGALAAGISPRAWSSRPDRIVIVPRLVNAVDDTWRTVVGFTLVVPAGTPHDLVVQCTGAAQVRSVDSDAGTIYPTGSGTGDLAGYLAIERHTRSTGVRTVYTAGAFDLYPQEIAPPLAPSNPASGYNYDRWHVVCVADDLVGGAVYDFTLVYVRGECPSEVRQIDLSEIQLTWSLS